MSNKQSSVDWLVEIIRFANKELYAEMFEKIEQAKAMHKDEIINATIYGDRFEGCYGLDSEHYYNETFGE